MRRARIGTFWEPVQLLPVKKLSEGLYQLTMGIKGSSVWSSVIFAIISARINYTFTYLNNAITTKSVKYSSPTSTDASGCPGNTTSSRSSWTTMMRGNNTHLGSEPSENTALLDRFIRQVYQVMHGFLRRFVRHYPAFLNYYPIRDSIYSRKLTLQITFLDLFISKVFVWLMTSYNLVNGGAQGEKIRCNSWGTGSFSRKE